MIDHVTLEVSDMAASRAFYEAVLEAVGWHVVADWPDGCGFGIASGGPTFWLRAGAACGPVHVAFRVSDREAVRAFHEAAMLAGGRNNGEPGLREYHASYYGAFALDPDGHNIEAVCHEAVSDEADGDEAEADETED